MVRQHERIAAEAVLSSDDGSEWQKNLRHRRRLVVAWIALCAISALTLILYSVGTPIYFAGLSALCTDCSDEHLTPAKAQALHMLGISIPAYAAYWTVINLLFVSLYFVLAALLFWRKPTNSIALFAAFSLLAVGASFPDIPNALATAHPSWWLPVALLDGLGLPSLVGFLCLFPSGRFVPGFTRWIAIGFAALYIPGALFPNSFLNLPHWSRLASLIMALGVFGSLVGAQVYRYRRISTQEERQQTKWVVFGITFALLGLLLLAFVPLAWLQLFSSQPLALLPSVFVVTGVYLALALIPLTITLSVLRYRLWDIDVLINRALVYSLLTASILGIYVLLVVALGAMLRAEGNFLISLFATGLIAVLFQPLRTRFQRGVNRLLYGQRDEPYSVLTWLNQRLEGTLAPDTVLSTIVETVAQALKLPYAAIFWSEGKASELAASYGSPTEGTVTLPLIYQAETIGQLQLAPRSPGETFTPADLRLLDELARQAGLAAHAVRLAADLQKARERLVLAREEERRRLRRDLHDGVGPTLASLSQRLDTACRLIPQNPEAAVTLLGDLKMQVKVSIADIRRVVYALRPPILDELGLVSALREYAMQPQAAPEIQNLEVLVEAPTEMPQLPAAVEVAAYRIALEALTNVKRHARAQRCMLQLEFMDARSLRLTIRDDGCGLPDDYQAGVGISSIRERVAELGGVCAIQTQEAGGTCVQVCLPISSLHSPKF